MTEKEAMKLALDALDIVKIHFTQSRHINEAIAALKERLADPMREVQRLGQEIEQKPVAWQWLGSAHFRKKLPKNADVTAWNPLYSAPQRTEPVACERCKQLEEHAYDLVGKLRVANIKLSMNKEQNA